MLHRLLALFPIARADAARAAAIVHDIGPGPLARAAAFAAILYVELILFAVAMGGGQ